MSISRLEEELVQSNLTITQKEEGEASEKEVRTFGLDLTEILGKNWQEQVSSVKDEDYQSSFSGEKDRHITRVKLEDGQRFQIMEALVESQNPWENISVYGGADFRKSETWLYAHNPKEDTIIILLPNGERQELNGTKEQFMKEINKFKDIYADENTSIKAYTTNNAK